ncbi:MAG: nucleoside deaminase [Thiohalomonadales bacterium]
MIKKPMFTQATQIQISLPGWLTEYSQRYTTCKDIHDRMGFVIEASRRNILEQTGGPFAAAIFESKSGKLISLGVNRVTTEKLSILHAEMIAITLAQRKLDTFDLGQGPTELEIMTSTEPCAMCLGAIPWSGVRQVITGATDADARETGFDEGAKISDWSGALEDKGIKVIKEVNRNKAKQVLLEYLENGGEIYNSCLNLD